MKSFENLLNQLADGRIVLISKTVDGSFNFREQCDSCFDETLTKAELFTFATGLLEIALGLKEFPLLECEMTLAQSTKIKAERQAFAKLLETSFTVKEG